MVPVRCFIISVPVFSAPIRIATTRKISKTCSNKDLTTGKHTIIILEPVVVVTVSSSNIKAMMQNMYHC